MPDETSSPIPEPEVGPDNEPEAGAPDVGPPAPGRRGGRLRRWLRGRPGAALAGSLAGALLAGSLVAWKTDALTLPWREDPVCWDALSRGTVADLVGDDFRADELPLRTEGISSGRVLATCRAMRPDGDGWTMTASVRDLDSLYGLDRREWPAEFLNGLMTPLGDGLTGMVSPGRAWVALPASCRLTGNYDPPTVVDVSWGDLHISRADDAEEDRAVLARGVVELANGVMDRFGCADRLPPPGKLPPLTWLESAPEDELCGLEGLRAPEAMRRQAEEDIGYDQLLSPASEGVGPVCELGLGRLERLRLITIEDPAMAMVYKRSVGRVGAEALEGDGVGSFVGDLGVFQAECPDGEVTFVAQLDDYFDADLARELFPAYVRAEGLRLGCGPLRVLPKP